jgi:GNAT superfamily N-acetyltransferase
VAPSYHVSVEDEFSLEDVAIVHEGLREFNTLKAGPSNRTRLAVFLRDPSGKVVGGLIGETSWQWLYVDAFWIDDSVRGQGYGARMLRAAETRARERGCTDAYLDTFSFQALPFYEKEGYARYGTLEGFPPGHRRFYLRKRLKE